MSLFQAHGWFPDSGASPGFLSQVVPGLHHLGRQVFPLGNGLLGEKGGGREA